MNINVIFEDKDIIVAEKGAAIPSQPDKTGDKDFFTMVCEYLNKSTEEMAVGLVHRLDRPVGGIMVFAKNKNSAINLNRQIQDKTFKKTYLAVVCGKPSKNSDILTDYLIKNQRLNISKAVNKNMKNAKRAELNYTVMETTESDEYGTLSLLKIELITGRHHQIRVQTSNAGFPLWGDTKYNSIFTKKHGFFNIALWAYSIEFLKLRENKKAVFKLPPKKEFPFSDFKTLSQM